MGKMQRTKGKVGELEVVNILKAAGVPAKRISMMESAHESKGDVEVAGCWKGQVKIGQHVPTWLYTARNEGEQLLFCRRNRSKWLVVMDLEFFLCTFL